jgi:hypothetical protein
MKQSASLEAIKLYKKSMKTKCWKLKYAQISECTLLMYKFKPSKMAPMPSHIYSLFKAKLTIVSREVKQSKSSIFLTKVLKLHLHQVKKNSLELAFCTEKELNAFLERLPIRDVSPSTQASKQCTPRLSIDEPERGSIFLKSKREALCGNNDLHSECSKEQATSAITYMAENPQQVLSISALRKVMKDNKIKSKSVFNLVCEHQWISDLVVYYLIGKVAKNCILEQIYEIYKENSKENQKEVLTKSMIQSNIIEDSILYVINNFLGSCEGSDTLLFIWKQLVPQQLKNNGVHCVHDFIDEAFNFKLNKSIIIKSIEHHAHFELNQKEFDLNSSEIFHKGDIAYISPKIFKSLYKRYKLDPIDPDIVKFDRMTIFEHPNDFLSIFQIQNDQLAYISILSYFLTCKRYDMANSAGLCYFNNYIHGDHDNNPLHITVFLALMHLNYQIGEFDIAFELYQKADSTAAMSLLSSHPMNVVIHMSIGGLLEERGSTSAAAEFYIKSIRVALGDKGKCNEDTFNNMRTALQSTMDSRKSGSKMIAEMVKSNGAALEDILNAKFRGTSDLKKYLV